MLHYLPFVTKLHFLTAIPQLFFFVFCILNFFLLIPFLAPGMHSPARSKRRRAREVARLSQIVGYLRGWIFLFFSFNFCFILFRQIRARGRLSMPQCHRCRAEMTQESNLENCIWKRKSRGLESRRRASRLARSVH